jgi:hypothetical protein
MQTFDEGNLRFTFPAAWVVLKYDDCLYYRGPVIRTGAGLAAVDFVAAPAADPASLLLIEVKDFRGHATANRPRMASGALATEIARKALDTLGALHAGLRVSHQDVRGLAHVLQPYPAHIQIVLLLEEDAPPQAGPSGYLSTSQKFRLATHTKLRGEILDLLQSKLKPFRLSASLYNCAELPASANWQAESVK